MESDIMSQCSWQVQLYGIEVTNFLIKEEYQEEYDNNIEDLLIGTNFPPMLSWGSTGSNDDRLFIGCPPFYPWEISKKYAQEQAEVEILEFLNKYFLKEDNTPFTIEFVKKNIDYIDEEGWG